MTQTRGSSSALDVKEFFRFFPIEYLWKQILVGPYETLLVCNAPLAS